MKLFHSPGACSLGIRVLLEEIGAAHEIAIVDVKKGEQRSPEYLSVNPKGKVPALLRDDGRLLTEYPAIALWLARGHPEAGLLPGDRDGEADAMSLLDYIVSTLHMRGTALIMRPSAFATSADAQAEVATAGRAAVQKGLAVLSEQLGDGPWLRGDRFSVCDSAALYVLNWREICGMELTPNLDAYHQRLRQRPSVIRAMQ